MRTPNFDIRPVATNCRDILPRWVRPLPPIFLLAALAAVGLSVALHMKTKTVKLEVAANQAEAGKIKTNTEKVSVANAILKQRKESAQIKALWTSAVFQTSPYLHTVLVTQQAKDDEGIAFPGTKEIRETLNEGNEKGVRATQLVFSDIRPDGDGFTMTLRGLPLQDSSFAQQLGKAWFNLLSHHAISGGYAVHKTNSPDETSSDWFFSATFLKKDSK